MNLIKRYHDVINMSITKEYHLSNEIYSQESDEI